MEAMERVKSWLGFEPEDFDDGIASLNEEIARYRGEISTAEAELTAHADRLNQLIEGDANITQSVLDEYAVTEARLRQNIGAIKRRIENREQRLAELEAAKESLRIAEQRRLTRAEAERGVESLTQWIQHMRLACDFYRSAQGHMK